MGDDATQTNGMTEVKEFMGALVRIVGGAAGVTGLAAAIVLGMGFVVTNTRLLQHGAFELSLVRNEFLAAGISFAVVTMVVVFVGSLLFMELGERMGEPGPLRYGAVIVGLLFSGGIALWFAVEALAGEITAPELTWNLIQGLIVVLTLVGGVAVAQLISSEALEPKETPYRALSGILFAVAGLILLQLLGALVRRVPAGAEFLERFGRAIMWGFVFLLVGGLLVKHLRDTGFWKEMFKSEPDTGKIGKYAPLIVLFLLVALVSFGGYAYPQLPKSWGGGSPIYVEFVVDEEAKWLLETLGLEVGENGLTERVEFLTASPERIFIATQQGDTLSFNPNLIKASKFYDVDFYASAEHHRTAGDWYGERRLWQRAIQEYDAALLIDSDLLKARLGRGMAYTELYIKSIVSNPENANQRAGNLADHDLNEAIRTAEKTLDNRVWSLAEYHLARLKYSQGDDKLGALLELKKAIGDPEERMDGDPSLRRLAMAEDVFKKDVLLKDEEKEFLGELRSTLSEDDSESELADEYASLAREAETEGQIDEAVEFYNLAIAIMESFVENDTQEKLRTADLMADKAEFLVRQDRFGEAIAAYSMVVAYDSTDYYYLGRLAQLEYREGHNEEAYRHCEEFLKQWQVAEEELAATVRCLISRGNKWRDENEDGLLAGARNDYRKALTMAINLGISPLGAEAYYELARLEARQGNNIEAMDYLERAVWLMRGLTENAENEVDFNALRESADFPEALSPPIISDIQSVSQENVITFRLRGSSDDFAFRLNTLTRILSWQAPRDIYNDASTGMARSFAASEDMTEYTFELKETVNAAELARNLRRLIGLPEQETQQPEETS